ncbi:EAL domain-containing protein [Brucella pituitosa]|uniref:EAL domain-containing protein n=1 Tax=Brucella pituitosa TaxID=571256 RepID=UPI0009A1F954|nr:EAL domain-containing protein [Brucella pituitosa]
MQGSVSPSSWNNMMSNCEQDNFFSARLEEALHSGEIQIHYQPVVRLDNQKMVGAEALLRWPGLDIGIEQVIKQAEEADVIDVVTAYVIGRVAEDLPRFRTVNADFQISINIAPQELASGSLLNRVKDYASSLPARALSFEITERQFAPLEKIAGNLTVLRDHGYQVYVDDFGTGFSSMSRLFNLPVDGFKLDPSFLQAAHSGGAIRAMAAFAKELGVEMVVEGVETKAHQTLLMAVDKEIFAQGWLFGPPMKSLDLLCALLIN